MRRLDPAEFEAGSHVLARAFHDDPLQKYVFPDPEVRRSLSPAHFLPLLRYGHLAGEVWTTDGPDIGGIGIWWPPHQSTVRPEFLEQAGFYALPEAIGADEFKRFVYVLNFIEPFHAQAIAGPHLYVMVIGVDPARQNTGVGAALMKSTNDCADAAGCPCYLETTQPKNVAFYRKFGYEVVHHGDVPETELFYWTLRRPPLTPSVP